MSADPDIEEHAALASASYIPQERLLAAEDNTDIQVQNDLAPAAHPSASSPPTEQPASPSADQKAHDSQTTDDPAAPSHFAPFFTILEDSASGEHHHPHVHYVFSDDSDLQTDTLTNALLQSLDPEGDHEVTPRPAADPGSASSTHKEGGEGSGGEEQGNPHTRRGTHLHHRARRRNEGDTKQRERHLILDVSSTGQSIVSAKSLSPEWQISGTEVVNAPTFADHGDEGAVDEEEEEEEAKMMLKIFGTVSAAEDGEEGIEEERIIRSAKRGVGTGKNSQETENEDLVKAMQGLTEKLRRDFEGLRRWVPPEQATSDR